MRIFIKIINVRILYLIKLIIYFFLSNKNYFILWIVLNKNNNI